LKKKKKEEPPDMRVLVGKGEKEKKPVLAEGKGGAYMKSCGKKVKEGKGKVKSFHEKWGEKRIKLH